MLGNKCKEPNVFSQLLSVISEKVKDPEIREEIYCEIIEIMEGEKLLPSLRFLVGQDASFDAAYKKVRP